MELKKLTTDKVIEFERDKDRPFLMVHGDAIEAMAKMPEGIAGMSVYSPPFPQVFAYSDSENDLGNSEDLAGEARLHFSFFFKAIRRILQPGRVMMVHATQIHRSKRAGEQGVFDFRGMLIRLAERVGFTFEYDWICRRNPQAQAIRTRKWEIKFQGLEADRAASRGAMPDVLLKFRAPGQNTVPIDSQGQVSRNDWIKWAEACWDDIDETDTLNTAVAKSENDTRHICPLQHEIVRRLVLLYSNPGEIVFSPFAGIGSEGYVALGGMSPKDKKKKVNTPKRILDPRRFIGVELKKEYYLAAIRNCETAIKDATAANKDLFSELEA